MYLYFCKICTFLNKIEIDMLREVPKLYWVPLIGFITGRRGLPDKAVPLKGKRVKVPRGTTKPHITRERYCEHNSD